MPIDGNAKATQYRAVGIVVPCWMSSLPAVTIIHHNGVTIRDHRGCNSDRSKIRNIHVSILKIPNVLLHLSLDHKGRER